MPGILSDSARKKSISKRRQNRILSLLFNNDRSFQNQVLDSFSNSRVYKVVSDDDEARVILKRNGSLSGLLDEGGVRGNSLR